MRLQLEFSGEKGEFVVREEMEQERREMIKLKEELGVEDGI